MAEDYPVQYTPGRTTEYYKSMCKLLYVSGWPNFFVTNVEVPRLFHKCHDVFSKLLDIMSWAFIMWELTSWITQNNLTDKQRSDSMLFCIAHPVICSYGITLIYYKESYRKLIRTLTIDLKKDYNDQKIERQAIKQAKLYSIALVLNFGFSIITYGFDGLFKVIYLDTAFTTVITSWPDVNDHSPLAGYMRVLAYAMWWFIVTRISFLYTVVISTTISLGYQFKQLQNYFYSLEDIFEENKPLHVQEMIYEKRFILGVRMHARTLWCSRQSQLCLGLVYSGQILINLFVSILLLSQMVNSERTMASVASTVTTLAALLFSTGFFMWNAGDIAVEAALLPTAMFHSGWHNCQNNTLRVRKMLVLSMMQAQRPVNIRAMGFIKLSYESYVSIVKSSYSIFSVLY